MILKTWLIDSKKKGELGVEVTWDNPEELEKYIVKLQAATNRLTLENRRLRKQHLIVCDKVVQLMGVDLLRQQQKWKDGLMEIRQIMANLTQQVDTFRNMHSLYCIILFSAFSTPTIISTLLNLMYNKCLSRL